MSADPSRLLGAAGDALAALVAGVSRDVGVEGTLDELLHRRRAVIELAADARVPGDLRIAALRRVVGLDQVLLAALGEERSRLQGELARLAAARRSLSSYRGPGPGAPLYVERLG